MLAEHSANRASPDLLNMFFMIENFFEVEIEPTASMGS